MGQRRDNQGRFARRLFRPAAPTAAAAPTAGKPGAKSAPKKTSAAKLKYDPRVDATRLEQALDSNLGWFARRALRKDLEKQFGKIDWADTTSIAEPEVAQETSEALPEVPQETMSSRMPGITVDTLRSFSGLTGTLWVRVAETGMDQFHKVAENARVELRPDNDVDVPADSPFAGIEHALVFFGPISERHQADDILFYPNSMLG